MIVARIVSCDPEMPVVRITATPVSSLMHVHSVFCVSLFIQMARIFYFVNSNSIRLLCKGWLAIAKLKPLSLFISLLLMLKRKHLTMLE